MALLQQLGINITAVYLLAIFIIAFMGLKSLVFVPYFKALEEREKKTKGGEEQAKGLLSQASELQSQYEEKARSISGEIKNIFDAEKSDAAKIYESAVAAARAETDKSIEEAKNKITQSVGAAKEQLRAEAPAVAQTITQKMLN